LIENLLISNVWFAVTLGALVFAAGYGLALYEVYLYHAGAKNLLVFEGRYDLEPDLLARIARRRWVNVRLAAAVVILSTAIFAVWQVCIEQYHRPDVFLFLIGGLVLLEAAADLRRFRNIVLFQQARRADGLQGKIEYSKRLSYTLPYVETLSFAALYALIFLVSSSWFFLGGAITCIVAGRRLRDWVVVFT
jgi:hypothetical protein